MLGLTRVAFGEYVWQFFLGFLSKSKDRSGFRIDTWMREGWVAWVWGENRSKRFFFFFGGG